MGRKSRIRVPFLPDKLLLIREALGLSQNEMLDLLNVPETNDRSLISAYERGTREPPLPVLLAYARAANVYVDALIDPELRLPSKLPSRITSPGRSINRRLP